MTVDEIIDALNAFQVVLPPEDYGNHRGSMRMRELFLTAVAAAPESTRAIPALIDVMARHADAHFHNHSTLAALLTRIPGWEGPVSDALDTAPSPLVVLAANYLRAANHLRAVDPTAADSILARIRQIANDPARGEYTRQIAHDIVNARPVEQIIADFDAFTPTDEVDFNYQGRLKLDTLCQELLVTPEPGQGVRAILGIMERFTDSDLGTPGPLVHTLEQIPGYETALVESVQRQPGSLSVEMIGRIRNSAPPGEARDQWEKLLRETAVREGVHQAASEIAETFLEASREE
jgi:hypothetical protein